MGRLVCCVCDTRNFSTETNFCCSRNCENLFLVMQGIALGNILQSIFRDICEVRFLHNKSDSNTKDVDTSTANEQSNKLSDFENPNQCHSVPEFKFDQGVVDFEAETEETEFLVCDDASCDSLAIGAERETASTDWGDLDTVHPGSKSGKITADNQHDGHSGRITYPASRKKRPTVSRKYAHTNNLGKVENLDIKEENIDIKLEDLLTLNTSRDQAAISEDHERKSAVKSESEQSPDQTVNTGKTAKRRVKCKHCGRMISKSYLYVHYRAIHKDNLQDVSTASLSCPECGKLFMRKQALNAHKLKQHNHEFSNTCSHCGKGFASRFGLSWHMRQVHKVTVRQCGACGETFENRRDYKKHRRYEHTTNSHVCHICGKGFKLKNALQAHLDAHAGVKLHFCEICGDGFVRFSSLCQHKNNLHGPKKSDLPFKCHLCPNTFRLRAWLEKHVVQKHQPTGDQVKADCTLCQDYLRTSVHCPVHGGTERDTFSCPQCDKVFSKETNLKAHMKQHQEPKFSCDICHKKFTYKCNMVRHRDTHNSEKQFHCEVCAKQFCSKFLLASHMRMHNQDLLFKCGICGKGLTRKDYLKNHLKKMHPDHAHV